MTIRHHIPADPRGPDYDRALAAADTRDRERGRKRTTADVSNADATWLSCLGIALILLGFVVALRWSP